MVVRILVVDNKGKNTKLLKEILDPLDYQVIPVVGNSLAIFLAHKNFPELIVTNLESADGNCLELAKQLEVDSDLATIPMVVIAESADETMRSQAMQLGIKKFITLPIDKMKLLQEIQPYLQARQTLRQPETTE